MLRGGIDGTEDAFTAYGMRSTVSAAICEAAARAVSAVALWLESAETAGAGKPLAGVGQAASGPWTGVWRPLV